ncbi:MAG: OmpA family protein [Acidiferrobacterales bacterium]
MTITNPNATALTGAAVSDTYPIEITNATPHNGATTCAGGAITAADGGPSVALTTATIPASGSCTVTVDVTSVTPGGPYLNTTGTVTSNEAPASATATDSLTVSAPALIEFQAPIASDLEATGGNIPNLIVTGVVGAGQTIDVNVTGGSATSGTDFANVVSITIPAGSYTGTVATAINLSIVDDTVVEPNETVDLQLANPSAGLTIGDANGNTATQSTHTYTINDDDQPRVELSTASASDIEASGGNLPQLLVRGTVAAATTVDVTVTGGSATGGGIDYTNVVTVAVPAGVYDGTLGTAVATSLAVVDDTIIEATETIDLQLANPSAGLLISDADSDGTTQVTHTYTINDDDAAIVLKLTKSANKTEAVVGDIITYRVELRNTITADVPSVTVADQLPPNFKYIKGSARLNGAPLADPSGNRPRSFNLGTVPALVDANGNGVADPGEPGFVELRYKLVVGSAAKPGDHQNTAVAVISICSTCQVSNPDRAIVTIIPDALFDLGTIIGKVFDDKNSDGVQSLGESGVPNVMVALDDGTYALTDNYGRYHFPAVVPGQRMVKINLQSVPGIAGSTTEEALVLTVTPGLLAKANFGILYEYTIEKIGRSGQTGVLVQTEFDEQPIRILGHAESLTVLVNDMIAELPQSKIQFRTQSLDDSLEYNGNQLKAPVAFSVTVDRSRAAKSWRLLIRDAQEKIVRTLSGQGTPPSAIPWDGLSRSQQLLRPGAIYQYQLEVDFADGTQSRSARQLFGVNRATAVSLNLSGGAFDSGSHQLTPRAIKILSDTAQLIRQYPNEKIVIEGHTDWVGADDYNADLSKRRAQAARDYLVNVEKLPAEQFVVRWYGESRPIASNESDEGREINRRVEISSKLTKVERAKLHDRYQGGEALVRIDEQSQPIKTDSRFATQVEADGKDRLAIQVGDSQGGLVQGSVPLPRVEILQLQKELLPAGEKTARYEVNGIDTGDENSSGGVAVTYTLAGRTAPDNRVELDGQPLEVDTHGFFMNKVALKPGNNTFGLVVRNKAGYIRIANLRITVSDQDENGPLMVTEPIPNLTVRLPPNGVPVSTEELFIPGATDPGNSVRINGQPVEVRADGTFNASVKLPVGATQLVIEAIDPQGHRGTIERVVVRKQGLFLLAFADTKFSRITGKGFLQGAGLDEKTKTVSEGRVAYYLKGTIAGKYLITSAFDSGTQDFDNLFDDLDEKENDRLLTNLNPDKFYPVYGDSSTIVYDAESQGKFYLAVDSDEIHGLVGNFPVSFSGTELATYQRTLYGGRFAYESNKRSAYGQPNTKAEVFAAEVRQAKVSDTLSATGGSLYYLSQRNVIEGSENVAIVVRHKDTGLELSRTPQSQNIDYTIKYDEGRIIFNRPIASVQTDDQLVNQELLQGNPVFVQVDYEVRLDSFEQKNTGARVRQQLGDHVAVGATYANEDQLSSNYELTGVDTEIRFGKNSRIVAEFAQSKGDEAIVFNSTDGGFTYTPLSASGNKEGDAYKLAAELDVGEWFGRPDRLHIGAYTKQLDPGFSSDGTQSERGTEKSGVNFSYKINKKDVIRGRHDRNKSLITPAKQNLTDVQWEHKEKRWKLTTELQNSDGVDATGSKIESTTAAARVDVDWSEKVDSYLEHQQTLDGPTNNQTTIGVDYQLRDKLKLGANVTTGTRGDSAQLGVTYELEKHRIYLAERVVDDAGSGRSTSTVVGSESDLGSTGKFYTEYQWRSFGQDKDNLSLIGARRRWDLGHGLDLLLLGERSELDTSPEKTTRYALAAGVTWDNSRGLTLSTRNEIRRETGGRDVEQFFTTNRAEYMLNADLKMLGYWRYSFTQDDSLGSDKTEFNELSLGFAYRPVANDRINALFRYTKLSNAPTLFQSQSDALITKSDVLSVEWSYQIRPKLEWVGKQAFKHLEEAAPNSPSIESDTYLTIQRFNYNFYKKFDVGAEYRILWQDEPKDKLQGWLLEFMWRPIKHLRVGVGYNGTDFSDDEFSDNNFSVKGWFFRLQGTY